MTAADDPFEARRRAGALGTPGPGSGAIGSPAADVNAALGAKMRVRQVHDDRRASLESMARRTGGFAVANTNDLAGGLRRIVEDTRGYYLIGFDSAADPGPEPSPGDVRIRVRRRDCRSARVRPGSVPPTRTRGPSRPRPIRSSPPPSPRSRPARSTCG